MRRSLLPVVSVVLALTPALARAQEPYSYPADPTDQLTVPGEVVGTEVTPEGNFYTGSTELAFAVGPDTTAWNQPVRTWENGWLPVIDGTETVGGLQYTLSAFADDVGNVPVDFIRMSVTNPTDQPLPGRVATSLAYTEGAPEPGEQRAFRFPRPVPYSEIGLDWQLGDTFDPDWQYAFSGDAVTRNGRLMMTFPDGAATSLRPDRTPASVPTSTGTGTTSPPSSTTTPTAPVIPVGLSDGRAREEGATGSTDATLSPSATASGPSGAVGQSVEELTLAPGASAHYDYKLPVQPTPDGGPIADVVRSADYDVQHDATVARWESTLAPADIISVPDDKAENTFRASLVQILGSRYYSQYRWIQTVNALRYHAFWLRDSSIMTHALDTVGLFTQAAQNLRFYSHWQRPNGLFISRKGQLDGVGQAIWALSEHAVRTRDRAFALQILPRIDKATTWIIRATAKDKYGLLPASNPGDDEYASGHLFGDDFWAVAGLSSAARLAQLLHDRQRTLAYRTERNILQRSVRLQVSRVRGRYHGAVPPSVEVRPAARDWGNLWAAWPVQVLDASSPAVTQTIAHIKATSREGLPTYGEQKRLHSYLGYRIFETELERRDRGDVVQGLFDSLAHTTATDGAAEIEVPPNDPVQVTDNIGPHGWFAAEYIELLRNMLVREDGKNLELFGAVPATWTSPGQTVALHDAPTDWGRVTASMTGVAGGANVTWSAALRNHAKLRLAFPPGVTDVHVNGRPVPGDRILLPGPSGSLAMTWTVPDTWPADASFDRSVARIRADEGLTGATGATGPAAG